MNTEQPQQLETPMHIAIAHEMQTGSESSWRTLRTEDGWCISGDFFEPEVCKFCGAMVSPTTAVEDAVRKRRFVYREHSCVEGEVARRQLAERRYFKLMSDPCEATIRQVARECHLPQRLVAGVLKLTRTTVNVSAIDAATAMIRQFQRGARNEGLYLHGRVGTGKTTISVALSFDLRNRTGNYVPPGWREPLKRYGSKAKVLWWDVPTLFDAMGSKMNGEPTEYDRSLLENADVLVLDDLGKEYASDYKLAELFKIINARYKNQKALIVTSNYPPDRLAERWVAKLHDQAATDVKATIDRIKEMCEVVELHGSSWRVPRTERR